MAIDGAQIQTEMKMNVMTRMLRNQVIKEIEDELRDRIMPDVNKVIEELARSAVEKWSISMQAEKSMEAFGPIDKILIKFVEEVIHKNDKEKIDVEVVK